MLGGVWDGVGSCALSMCSVIAVARQKERREGKMSPNEQF